MKNTMNNNRFNELNNMENMDVEMNTSENQDVNMDNMNNHNKNNKRLTATKAIIALIVVTAVGICTGLTLHFCTSANAEEGTVPTQAVTVASEAPSQKATVMASTAATQAPTQKPTQKPTRWKRIMIYYYR